MKSFVDKLTSCHLDFHANLSAQLVRSEVWKMKDICSPTLPKESESCNLELFSQKMFSESSVAKQERENLFSNMSEEHWKKWVTQLKSEYSQRVKLACPTKENESSSVAFPTPRSSDAEGGTVNWGTPKEQDSRAALTDRGKHNLGEQVHGMHNFPTPTSRDWKGAYSKKSQEKKPRNLLPDAVGEGSHQDQANLNTTGKNQGLLKQRQKQILERNSWNTPTNGRADQGVTESQLKRRTLKLNQQIDVLEENIPQVLRLNPDWVEQLMGLPKGWTKPNLELTDSEV
jgi:hypothetical protein